MTDFEVLTFRLTISVPGDISEACIDDMKTYLMSRTKYMYFVKELSTGDNPKWHAHIAMCFKTAPKSMKDFKADFCRYHVKKYHPDIGRRALLWVAMYNHDWYDQYLKKSADTVIVFDNYDRESVTSAFPSLEIQQQLVEAAATSSRIDAYRVLVNLFVREFRDEQDLSMRQLTCFYTKCVLDGEIALPRDERTMKWVVKWAYMKLTGRYLWGKMEDEFECVDGRIVAARREIVYKGE